MVTIETQPQHRVACRNGIEPARHNHLSPKYKHRELPDADSLWHGLDVKLNDLRWL